MNSEIFYILKAVANDGFINSLNDFKELYKLFEGVNFNLNTLFYYNSEFGVYNIEFDILDISNIGVPMRALFECMYTVSNGCFHKAPHRELHLSILDAILLQDVYGMYRSVTYGTAPNATCRYNIGRYTGMRYKNCDIAYLLIQIKIDELRTWLLNNYKFNDREKRLLRGLKND